MNIIVDNTVFTNFAFIKREDILKKVFENNLFTSEAVLEELKRGEEKGILPKRDWNWIKVLKIEYEQEKHNFELISRRLGKGEAACLSLAVNRNLKVLTDDLDTRIWAQRRGIPVSGTIGVLIAAINKKIISLEEGNNLLLEMIECGYFSPYKTLDSLL